MDRKKQSWWSYFGFENTNDMHKSTTTDCVDLRFAEEKLPKENRIVSLPPSGGKEERFKAVVSGKLTSGVDIDVGPKYTTVGFTTESQGKTFYTMPDVRNDSYKFVRTDNNPKIKRNKGDGVISFVLEKTQLDCKTD